MWHVLLFGGLRARPPQPPAEGGSASLLAYFGGKRPEALLALVVLRGGSSIPRSREELAALLWPDADPEAARNRLRQTLITLRRTVAEVVGTELGDTLLVADREGVALAPGVTTDVAEFESALRDAARAGASDPVARAAALRRALALSEGGELLPGLYEDVILAERDRLSGLRNTARLRLADALLAAGDPDGAVTAAQEAVAADPDNEETRVILQRALAALSTNGTPPRAEGATWSSGTLAPAGKASLVGREEEREAIRNALLADSTRAALLVGPGGAGKTYLTRHILAELAPHFDTTLFLPLAAVREAKRIPELLAAALETRNVADGRSALVALDNVEQMGAREVAEVITELLEEAPSLRLLITSRVRLPDLIGSGTVTEIPIGPLPVPLTPGTPTRLLEFPAVALFDARARLANPGFAITRANAADVAALCRRLDGLPLALELAAGRAGVLSPRQILERLGPASSPPSPAAWERGAGGVRGDLLRTARAEEERHRSLEAVLEWGWHLLAPDVAHLFARLSIFRGGFTADAVEEVTAEPLALDYLQELRDASLLTTEADETGHQVRFGLLETVRTFAAGRLPSAEIPALTEAHATYFAGEGRRLAALLRTGEGRNAVLAEFDAARPDLNAALLHLLTQDAAAESALELFLALDSLWDARGLMGDMREAAGYVLNLLAKPASSDTVRPALRAEARLATALVLRAHGERAAARAALEIGLEDARRAPADEVLPLCARLSANLGLLLTDAGEYTAARAYHAEAAAVFRQLGDTRREAASRNNLGLACLRMGDREAAETAFAESLTTRRAMDDALGTVPNLANLSELALLRGDIPRATEFAEEAFRIARERRGGDRLIALGAATLGAAREAVGDLPDAVALYREALSLRWNGGHYGAVVELLLRLALIAAQREGQREIAIRLLAGLTALEDRAFGAVEIARRDTAAATLRAEHTDTGNQARFESLWSEGATLGTGDMVALALSEAEGEPARETISVK